jgi:hypothetical protein
MEEYAVDVDVDNSVAKVTDIRYWQWQRIQTQNQVLQT